MSCRVLSIQEFRLLFVDLSVQRRFSEITVTMSRCLTFPRNLMCAVLVALVLCLPNLQSDAALESCMWGTYLTRHGSGEDMCRVCDNGTFMPDKDHKHRQCYNCSRVVDATIEVVIQPCDIYKDAIIQCIDGYYRRRARNGRDVDKCTRCSPCENATRKCMNYTDTVCCLPHYEAVERDPDVFHCEERPCRLGEYFDTKTDQCVPCPQDTYMPANFHKQPRCLKCAHLEDSSTYNSTIFNNCTDRSPTIFGCLKGHYRNLTGPSLVTEAMCTPCTDCQCGVSRSCSDFGDALCKACEDPSIRSVKGVTNSPGSEDVTYTDRPCCEHDNCECQPRYVNGSPCECSRYPRNYFTSTTPEPETSVCDHQSDKPVVCLTVCLVLPLVAAIITVLAVVFGVIKCKRLRKQINANRTELRLMR